MSGWEFAGLVPLVVIAVIAAYLVIETIKARRRSAAISADVEQVETTIRNMAAGSPPSDVGIWEVDNGDEKQYLRGTPEEVQAEAIARVWQTGQPSFGNWVDHPTPEMEEQAKDVTKPH
jgi:hypothetical protein